MWGYFTFRGCQKKYEMTLKCPCNCIEFKLIARPVNREETGEYI